MEYEIIAIFWLLMSFYGSVTLYIIGTVPSRVKQTSCTAEQEAQESLPYDFANLVYAHWWLDTFSCSDGYGKAYWLNSYLGLAKKYNFTIPGKECATWWRDMVKGAKPASPARPVYYEHITIRPPLGGNAHYQRYGVAGFGVVPMHTSPLCDGWFEGHFAKYPGGFLPEQTIIRGKVKA